MRVVSASDIDRALDAPALVDALARAFAADAMAPERHHHAIGNGSKTRAVHLLMPAWTAPAPGPGSFLGTKIVNVFPDNAEHNLPAVLGVYLLQSGETGAPLAVIDGTRLTHWRTAAVSALAARFLARADASRLLMVGSGALAPFLVRAHASVRPIAQVDVWNHRPAGAEALAATLRGEGIAAQAVADLDRALASADVVSCATLSAAPLLQGAALAPGTHVDLVGAFTMAMREADDAALRRARVFIDTPAALLEGGDVAVAIRDGALAPADVVADLRALCRGEARGRGGAGEITLFKAVGTALADLATAMLIWDRTGAP